ncbi:YitT family protein [Marivita sp. GX14005]|uniref:YitT family protein n=1 Tax=Marivita sp. GX14005 TaxID=2942276 RepID=UPI002019A74E|nr:YitT family protein [Marivita sp. GX14005]MCL3883748.1 YitT family protein [Marivita sp. GX14005]
MILLGSPPPDRHSPFEDALAILTGATLVALGVQFLAASHLLTGQIAGLSLLGDYLTGWSFGAIFFVLNLPFYALGVVQMGWRFTLKTFAAVGCMSAIAELLPLALTINDLHPAVGAALAGTVTGVGLLLLFRHGATLGGVGIVALWLQDTRGIKAGNVQLGFDLIVFTLALLALPWQSVLWSLFGAAILNMIITVNHRRDRYVARS